MPPDVDPIELLATLATAEARAGGFREMTPAHLLIALSRISEPDPRWPDVGADRIREQFDGLGIAPRRFRRRLRFVVGQGDSEDAAMTVSRSPRCRDIFAAAAMLAGAPRKPLPPSHLLRANWLALAWDFDRSHPLGDTAGDRDAIPVAL